MALKPERKHDLKILIVTESYPPVSYGGGEISCQLLAESLAEREGIEVTVITSSFKDVKEEENRDGVKVLRRLKTGEDRESFFQNLKRKIFFKRSVKKEVQKIADNYDLIHFFNITSMTELSVDKPTFATINSYINFCPKGNLFYKEESVCEGCSFLKFIGCLTNSEFIGNYRLNRLLKYNPIFWVALYLDYKRRYKTLNFVDHFFSLSEFINELLIDSGVDEKHIQKTVNIPDIEELDNKEDIEIETNDEIPTIAFIGVLSKIKGVDLLIKAFQRVESEAELIIVGDGPEREKLEGMVRENEKIDFLGKVEHGSISSIYKRSSFVVVTSLWPEPLSRVLLEAAYFGKPIIATDVGGNPDIVKHGYNGFLVKPEVEDLVKKLEYMIENGRKKEMMEKNMRRFFKKRLSKDKIVEKIIDGYYQEFRAG